MDLNHLPQEPGIYVIINLNNGKVYVGQSKTMRRYKGIYGRCRRHLELLRKGKDSLHLQRAWNQGDRFEFQCLQTCPPEECDTLEEFYIEKLESWKREKGYNLARKACGGGKFTEETIEKMRRFRLSPEHKAKLLAGQHPHTDETRNKISASRKGKRFTPEHIENLRLSGIGRKHSEETKAKLSKIRSGWKHTEETKLKLSIIAKGVSEETRRKMSQAKIGRGLAPERREALANTVRGTVWVKRGEERRRIQKELWPEFESLGWERGKK